MPALEDKGDLNLVLPRPDMVVTHSQWDVYLPDDLQYQDPESNMEVSSIGTLESYHAADNDSKSISTQGAAIDINVPTQGMHFSFNKLYANQSEKEAYVSFEYASKDAETRGMILSLIAVLMLGIGLMLAASQQHSNRQLAVFISFAAVGLGGYAHLSLYAPVMEASIALVVMLVPVMLVWLRKFKR